MSADWRESVDPWDWGFEQMDWDASTSVWGAEGRSPRPERGVSAEIEAAVVVGRLLFASDPDLIALWADRAEEMLLRIWRPKGFNSIRHTMWRVWHGNRAREVKEELESAAAQGRRSHFLLIEAALRFDGFAEAALAAEVLAFLERKRL